MSPLRLAVLISGKGSNLQAIIDAIRRGQLPAVVATVISNRADAFGLERARRAGIAARILRPGDYPDRPAYDRALMAEIDAADPGLLVLAGYMRILTTEFVNHYGDRIVNIHPSLLPKYPGLNTHERVLANGDREHGASVHFVTADLDAGPVIIQGRVTIAADDTPATLEQRVHQVEHRILPQAIKWFAEDRLSISNGRVLLDGLAHAEQGLLTDILATA